VFHAFLISVQLRNITPAIQYNSKEQEQRNLMTYGMLYGTKRQKDTYDVRNMEGKILMYRTYCVRHGKG